MLERAASLILSGLLGSIPGLLFSACASTRGSGLENAGVSDPARFHRALGRTYLEQRDFARATNELERSLAADEGSAETHALLGIAQRERGLSEEAEASLLRAIDCDDELADAYSALGILYDRLGRHEEAAARHREALELDPRRSELHNNLGFSLYLRGELVEAIKLFRAALRLGAGDRSHNNLGFTYGRMGDVGRAFRAFRRGGTEAEAHNNIGYVYEVRGDRHRAESAYRKALALDPGLAKAKENLEHLLSAAGSPSESGRTDPMGHGSETRSSEGNASRRTTKMVHGDTNSPENAGDWAGPAPGAGGAESTAGEVRGAERDPVRE